MFRYLATVLNKGATNGAAAGTRRLDVRVDGPICGKLCPPVAVAGRRLRVVRPAGAGAPAKGEQLVLRPVEAARLLRRAGHDPRGTALRSAFLEGRVMPHLGGRLAHLALRGGGESTLDLRPLAGTEGCAFEPGGLYDALAAWRALADPPILHPFHSGDRVEPRLSVGAFACAADGQGGTLVLFDPQAAVRVELVGQRHRVRVRLGFPPRRLTDGPCAVALAVCDRVAASPYGVAGAAAKAPDRQGRVRVAVLVRETGAADERLFASVGGQTWPLLSRDLGAAGTVRAGALLVSADAWRRESLVVTTPRGGYRL